MSILLLFARVMLAVVFVTSGIAKLADPLGSRKSLAGFGVPESIVTPFAWLLPLAELLFAAALIPVASAWWGAVGVLILLLTFITGISVTLIRGGRPDCHCFGQLHSAPIGWKTLIRNGILASVAASIVSQGSGNPGASLANAVTWGGISGVNSVVAAFAFAIACLAAFQVWALLHVLRQNGRLMLRLEAVEGKTGGSVQAPEPGLPPGWEAPPFGLPNLAGESVTLGLLSQQGKPVLLLFSEPGCGACEAAIQEVAGWQQEHADRLLIIPVSRGTVKENRAKGDKYGLQNVLLQTDREVAQAYQVEGTPSAVLIKKGRIDSPLAVGIDAIRGVVVRATLPPPLNQGDTVPSLRLPDLSGEMTDIAQLKNQRTLVLFWSPSCGYCQQMLDDIRKWEMNRREDALDLMVITVGAADENRRQGFRSRVLVDQYYAASHVFNSGGTPSAVLVVEGRVASGVAIGAQAVFELAGASSHQPV